MLTIVMNVHTKIHPILYKEANFVICIGRKNVFQIIGYSKNKCYH